MRNFKNLFESLTEVDAVECRSGLRLLSVSPLLIYYGFTGQHKLRLAFLGAFNPIEIPSTKAIKVAFHPEDKLTWLTFDLYEQNARDVYYSLCDDLVSSIESMDATNPDELLMHIKNRFFAWKQMFRQERNRLSEEQILGLLGELYFLEHFLIPEIGPARAIEAWSGIDGLSKDFAFDDKWYEVKTVSLNSNLVKINSITQLASDVPGGLSVIRYETMSKGYDDESCTVFKVFRRIMSSIEDDDVRAIFISKLVAYGFDIIQETDGNHYRISEMVFYKVADTFPRIQESDIRYREVDKVTYCLILNSLDRFKFDGRL